MSCIWRLALCVFSNESRSLLRGRYFSSPDCTILRALVARVYAVLGVAAAGTGAVIAGRHVYIQHLPADQVPSCGPGLDYLLDAFPLADAIEMVFTGSGECAEINWSFLGLSMPGWALVWFVLLGGLAIVANGTRLSR